MASSELDDFTQQLTISEYYDRDRRAFYATIEGDREQGIDLTGWLDFLVTGLATQLDEVKERGERVIVRDVLAQQHGLSPRQAVALGDILERGGLTIQDFEKFCPETNRRSLQRDLKAMLDKGLLVAEGSTNQLVYRLRD